MLLAVNMAAAAMAVLSVWGVSPSMTYLMKFHAVAGHAVIVRFAQGFGPGLGVGLHRSPVLLVFRLAEDFRVLPHELADFLGSFTVSFAPAAG